MELYQHILISLNAIICALIVIRLVTFERRDFQHTHSWPFAFLVYVIVIGNAAMVIRTLTGDIADIDFSSVINNCFLCVALMMLRGNIRELFSKSTAQASRPEEQSLTDPSR